MTGRSEATWLTIGGRATAAHVHLPEGGQAWGAVLLVPPPGREHLITFRALRSVAVSLADHGFVAVRVDLTGDGESCRAESVDDLAEAWREDVAAALTLARQLVPGAPVSVIGLRVGAALAAEVPADLRDRVLAWEPVSPRRWVRTMQTMRTLAVAVPTVDPTVGTELLGGVLTAQQRQGILRLKAPDGSEPGVITRHEPRPGASTGLYATDVAHATTPQEALREIPASLPRAQRPVPVAEWEPRRVVEVRHHEAVVRLEFVDVGPHRLTGTLTTPVEPGDGEAVLFVAGSVEPRGGPSGLWTMSALDLAARGHTALRVDRRGSGELSDPSSPREPMPYTNRGPADYRAAAAWLRERSGTDLVAVGICAGSWHAARAARDGGFATVISFNNPAWQLAPAYYAARIGMVDFLYGIRGIYDFGDDRQELVAVRKHLARGARGLEVLTHVVSRRLPAPARAVLSRAGVVEYPEILLRSLPRRTRFVNCLGDVDGMDFDRYHGERAFQAMARDGYRHVTVRHPELDHGLLAHSGRAMARRLVIEWTERTAEERRSASIE